MARYDRKTSGIKNPGTSLEIIRQNVAMILSDRGLNPSDLARLCGVSPTEISRWLTSAGGFRIDKLDVLAQGLRVHPHVLLMPNVEERPHKIEDCLAALTKFVAETQKKS